MPLRLCFFKTPIVKMSPALYVLLQVVLLVYANTDMTHGLIIEDSEENLLVLVEVQIREQEVTYLLQCIRTEVEVFFERFIQEPGPQLHILFPILPEGLDGYLSVLSDPL